MTDCSICGCDFDLDAEGGIQGDIGILPVAFCVTCYAGIFDMVQQRCWTCIEQSEEDEMERKGPTIEEFERIRAALANNETLGDSLIDGLKHALALDLESQDVEKALLFMDTQELMKHLVMWRRRFIEEAIVELDASANLGTYQIDVMPKEIPE